MLCPICSLVATREASYVQRVIELPLLFACCAKQPALAADEHCTGGSRWCQARVGYGRLPVPEPGRPWAPDHALGSGTARGATPASLHGKSARRTARAVGPGQVEPTSSREFRGSRQNPRGGQPFGAAADVVSVCYGPELAPARRSALRSHRAIAPRSGAARGSHSPVEIPAFTSESRRGSSRRGHLCHRMSRGPVHPGGLAGRGQLATDDFASNHRTKEAQVGDRGRQLLDAISRTAYSLR